MKTGYTVLLAAAITGGSSCHRVLQDFIPVVGVRPAGPSIVATSESMSTTTADEEELKKALEFDDNVTVVSPIEVGELLCDTLVDAEGARYLSFVLLDNEQIVAEKTSYFVANGNAFTDGIGRKVWTGTVTGPAQGEDEAVPRTVSMVWGEVCDTETFLLKVVKRNTNEKTSIVKTIPCFGSTTNTCLVKVEVEFAEHGEGVMPPDDVLASSTTSSNDEEGSTTDDSFMADSETSGNRLPNNGDTVIDVMILYSTDALDLLGQISNDQMETTIIESIAWTNEATVNSEVALFFNCVHIGPLPYEQETLQTSEELVDLRDNDAVASLRDTTGADLVQMIGDFEASACGRGYYYSDSAVAGASVVRATCLDNYSMPHEFGHNLGCRHNREDTISSTDYAHGQRYCDGDNRYRTIMSYGCDTFAWLSPRVLYFSNPDVTYLDKATGTSNEDNARAIRDNMVAVSKYKDSLPAPDGYKVLGCVRDIFANRVLSGIFKMNDLTMTTEVCAAFCKGSQYIGTEYGRECFCGGSSDDPTELGDASCSYSCAGDASQTCGGFNAISVYEKISTIKTQPLYRGCWTDSRSDRIMNVMIGENTMTNDRCETLCSSYPFYGTQYGRECWCGDGKTDYTSHGNSTSCTYGCTGDNSMTCGGFYAMSVYEQGTVANPAESLGCWKDVRERRILDVMIKSNSMTNDLCDGICSTYAFFGTQYGRECWCGGASSDYTAYGESTSCDMGCTGDSGSTCGGFYAMSMWKHT